MTNETELQNRIRQLEDEVDRLRAVNENARAERAHELFCAWLSGGCAGIDHPNKPEFFLQEAVKQEQAFVDQMVSERLGKQAEME